MLGKVLVANRGEVAVRVIRACREAGVRSVAVYSEADRMAPHVRVADEAYELGPARSAESYLSIERILGIAERAGCDAVHPGYGFLAENAEFARAVTDRDLVFIGPRADTIGLMGEKTRARRTMEQAGVPVVPGSEQPLADLSEAREACQEIGYPVLLKAAGGGGGRGMRRVESAEQLAKAWEAACREAESAFSDGRVYAERLLERPRHVEIQILADAAGHVVHLGERECTIQRRHQKLIEESPSPALSPELREWMGRAAVTAARTAEYVGAGTVEFLLSEGSFYFLEMNTRLQVEHPVTEMVTGVDIVEWQLRIAAGQPLELDSVLPTGHAIECRITAEDPFENFMPSGGRIEELWVPGGPGVRWDAGIVQGSDVTLHYDSLLAKLIVHADDRAAAIDRMARALDEASVLGVPTPIPLYRRVMREGDFRAGDLHTGYLAEHADLLQPEPEAGSVRAAAVAAAMLEDAERRRTRAVSTSSDEETRRSAWRDGPTGWQDPLGSRARWRA